METEADKMKILVCFENRVRPDSTGVYFVEAFRQLGHDVTHITPDKINEVGEGYDFYLRVDDGLKNLGWNQHLRPSAYFVIDTHIETDWRIKLANEGKFDAIHVCHKQGLSLPFDVPPVWTPVGCDPYLHNVGQRDKVYNLCFIGNFHSQYCGRRVDMLDAAIKETPHSFFFGNRTFKDMAQKYAESRIVFNCSLNGDVNMRVFEAMCSGSCLLTDRLPEMKELGFEDGVHYVGYETRDEVSAAVRTLLGNPAMRERIAEKGRDEVLANHTYAVRAKGILSQMENRLCLVRP